MEKYDLAVFIGRFQPFTLAHKQVAEEALKKARKLLILVGSAQAAPSYKNPFTFAERKSFINFSMNNGFVPDNEDITIEPIEDSAYNVNAWVADVQQIVSMYFLERNAWKYKYGPDYDPGEWYDITTDEDGNEIRTKSYALPENPRICLVGNFKDDSSFYLNLFPQWDLITPGMFNKNLSATDVRECFFSQEKSELLAQPLVGEPVFKAIQGILEEDFERYQNISDEYSFIQKYKAQWSVAPYPPVFVTTDALVINKGHILLIKRGLNPGKGLWALPGGFLNPNESITDCAVRELKEETKIDVPVPVLKGSITKTEMFDHPNRDPRGRVITHCFRFDVTYGKGRELIKIKAGDDAVGAQWVPIGDLLLMRKTFFSDHFQIIRKMLGL